MASATGSMDASMGEQPETGFLNGAVMSSDWYDGHKVVAMPSSAFGGLSIREVVSSRNETLGGQRPRRSSSLGRQPVRPGGRDIVQDVYDRMGVSYTRGINYESNNNQQQSAAGGSYDEAGSNNLVVQAPSFSDNISDFTNNSGSGVGASNSYNNVNAGKMKDKFSGKYKAAAAAASNTRATPARGRSRPANPAGRMTEPRGRTAETQEPESEGRRRARSLSRGLSVRGMWPPPKDGQPMEDDTPVPQQPSTKYQEPVGPTNESSAIDVPNSPLRPKSPVKRSHSFDARPQYGGGRRSISIGTGGGSMHNQYHTNKMRPPVTATYMDLHSPTAMREEKKDNDDRSLVSESQPDGTATTEDTSSPPSLPSIKDRMKAFAGKSPPTSSSQRNPRRNTFGGPVPSYGKSTAPPPPKVDIYQHSSRYNEDSAPSNYHPDDPENYDGEEGPGMEDDYSQQQGPPEPSNVPPSSAATAAAEAAAMYVRPSQMAAKKASSSTRHSTGSAKSSLVNSYLSGIQSSTSTTSGAATNPARNRSCFQQQPPMSDISSGSNNQNYATEEMNGGAGVVGHTMSDERSEGGRSSISYSEPGNSVRKQSPMWRKPAASYNSNNNYATNKGMEGNGGLNSPSAYSSSINNNNNSGNSNAMSADMIEKMVDERVQVQLREVESRMEGLLRRWMDQMNNKITSRLDAMEASIKESMPNSPRHEI